MSSLNASMIEIPISMKWKLSKEKILSQCKTNSWLLSSEKFNVHQIPGVRYYLRIGNSIKCNNKIIFGFIIETNEKMNVACKISIPSANFEYQETRETSKQDNAYANFLGTMEELLNPANYFFIIDFLIITLEAILRVDSKESNVASNFHFKCNDLGPKLWNRNDKDFTILVAGKELRVHKNVISSQSPVFDKMIQSGLKESIESKVTLIEFNFETVEIAMKFCYSIEISNFITAENGINLLQFSDKYDINDLRISMETFLSSKISPMNVSEISNASILSNSTKLREKCFNFMLDCMKKSFFVKNLDSLDKDLTLDLVKSFCISQSE